MPQKLKIKRGPEANRQSITPDSGEIIVTTDTKRMYLGDGTTPGGNLIISIASYEWTFTSVTNQTEYTPTSGSEPFHNPSNGIYLVFYGGTKLHKNDYTIDANKLTLNFQPEVDDVEINIVYVGI